MRSTIFRAKTPKLYFGQNSWLVGPRGISEEILIGFFFSCKRFFQFFLKHQNKQPTSFRAKTPKLYSGQNSWPVGPKGIFDEILI